MEENIDDSANVIERWKETFDMTMTKSGGWTWEPFWDAHNDLVNRYNDLVRRWNKYVPVINDRTQPVGRPLASSEEEQDTVLRLRKARHVAARHCRGSRDRAQHRPHHYRQGQRQRPRNSEALGEAHPGEVWRESAYEPIGRIDNRGAGGTGGSGRSAPEMRCPGRPSAWSRLAAIW